MPRNSFLHTNKVNMHPSEYIADIKFSLPYFIPEIALLSLLVLLTVLGIVFKKQSVWLIPAVFFMGISYVFCTTYQQWGISQPIWLYSGTLYLQSKTVYFKLLIAVCGVFTVVFREISVKKEKTLEFYLLITSILFGANLLAMSYNFLVSFLALEIVSLSSYALVAMFNEKPAAEASVKYLIYGMMASGIMLYGISLLFGITGSLNFNDIIFTKQLINSSPVLVTVAFLMVFAGVLFKISAFPLHFWSPDVYQSSAVYTVAFFSTATKIAGFALLFNLLPTVWQYDFKCYVSWFRPELLLGLFAILSLLVGNFAALGQTSMKRMLAYSAIAHSGFILLPLTSFESQAYESAAYYMGGYIFITFLAFFAISLVKTDEIASYKGLGLEKPFWGIAMIVAMVALTGLPPTVGFISKFYIFSSVWDSYSLEQEKIYLFLLVFGVLNAVVSLFYYLKPIYYMYLKSKDSTTERPSISVFQIIFLVVLSILVVGLFIKPDLIKLY